MDTKDTRQGVEEELRTLQEKMSSDTFWNDKENAQSVIKRIKELQDIQEGTHALDKGGAIITILAGAGGDDSEDFAYMVYEMYSTYCATKGYSSIFLEESKNDKGGYRHCTIEITGKNVYGTLKNESGVHRLVRISPFNAQAKRHTSFALVEVLPILPMHDQKVFSPDDIRIETSKSSGPGGQNVNKRETAIRVIHIPTNISVSVSTERKQDQNKQKALQILQAKIFKIEEDARKKELEGSKISATVEIEWGSQIRSYVLHPYKMIKDHRTGYETSNVEAVLEKGDLEGFIEAEKNL